jgi:hypothetical protein
MKIGLILIFVGVILTSAGTLSGIVSKDIKK